MQLTAEAYISDEERVLGTALERALRRGNNRTEQDSAVAGVTRFAESQAKTLLERFAVVHQLSDQPGLGQATVFNGIPLDSGFSATLIQEIGTNNFILAIRSTESKPWAEGGDQERDEFGADVEVALTGFAWAQIDTMEKYYAWLKSSGTLPPNAHLDVTGYSLGGHLATIFTELHRGDPEVNFGEAITFNAPGRGTASGSIGEMLAFYRAVLANPDAFKPSVLTPPYAYPVYTLAKSTTGPLNGLSIYNDPRHAWAQMATQLKYATVGVALMPRTSNAAQLTDGAAGSITVVSGTEYPSGFNVVSGAGLHGPLRNVFIEAQPTVAGLPYDLGGQGDYGGAHSIVLLADSLALMRVLNEFDPQQDIDALNALFSSASSRKPRSTFTGDGADSLAEFDALENVLDAMRRMLLGPAVARTEYGIGARGFGDIRKRDVFYANIDAVSNVAALDALKSGLDLVRLKSDSVQFLAGSARVDFADHLALQMLSPFALKPKEGVSGVQDALRSVWAGAQGSTYSTWLADGTLNASQRSLGAAAFSEQWYRDRTAMLRWVLRANEQNIDHAAEGGFLIEKTTTTPAVFQDLLTQTRFIVAAQALPLGAPGVAHMTFGADDADAIAGADAEDHLYGGGGDDTISGYEGKDYLEGNAGIDLLDGGLNDDTLLGGSGNDTLIGGEGADRLLGGADYDRYVYSSGQGRDTIVDSDGKGHIEWDGTMLTGGLRLGENFWLSEQGFTYSLSGSASARQTLYVGKLGVVGQLVIDNFSRADNDLSIVLSSTPRTKLPAPTTRSILGDLQYFDADPAPGIQLALDDLGNAIRTPVPEPGKQDFLNDSAGNDTIRSGGGADYIKAFGGGADDIDAGDGVDGVSAGDGDDWIAGGNDADELAGGNGSDMIFGGAGDDVILAEHDFSTDSATWRLPIGPGVEEIRWWTYDGRFAASGYGISVVRYTFEGITFETPWVGVYALKELHDPSALDYVDAGDGADLVHGGDGTDIIFGGAGSDRIECSAGDDFADGGSGNDQIMGDAPISTDGLSSRPVSMQGNDQLFGGTGDDLLMGGNGVDMLDGGEGNDVLYGDMCGVDSLLPQGIPVFSTAQAAMPADDVLRGGAGNDRLYGEFGADVLAGGAGEDQLDGGSGADVYEYDRGDGADTILAGEARNDYDELRFGPDIRANDVTLTMLGQDLVVATGVPGDVITLKGWFTPGAERQLGRIAFADGAAWSRDDINTMFVVRQTGSNGADVMRGFAGRDEVLALAGADDVRTNEGDDLIEGGLGNDYLDGGPGSDRYVFRAGDGNDTIAANDLNGNDVLLFVGVRREDATFSRVGDALVVSANGGLDKVTLTRYFEQSYVNDGRTLSGVQTIEFEGGARLNVFDVRALFQTPVNGTAGNDYLAGGSADESIAGGAGNDIVFANGGNDTLLGGDGNDSLDAGVGADVLDGGSGDDLLLSRNVIDASRPSYLPVAFLNNGDDTFVFGRGYGHDSVEEDNPGAISTDTVFLKDLFAADVAFGRGDAGTGDGSGGDNDLIIRVRTSGDTLRLARFFNPDPRFWVEQVRFADGTVWTRDQVLAGLSSDGAATPVGDYLLGSPAADAVQAGAGNDIVWLGEGNDLAAGDDGDDHLQGGAGNDVLIGGAGSDRLFGGIGADILDGGPGNDDLYGGLGPNVTDSASDTYIFRRGSGRDVVRDTRSSGASDVVFLDGLGASDVELGWTADGSLRIRVIDTGDTLVFDQHFTASSPNKLEWILFADGTRYDTATIEQLARPNRDEYLSGTSANDIIDGGGGNDQISGGAGDDTLRGGTGDDTLIGDAGADSMEGGTGDDLFFVDASGDAVIESLNGGTDRVSSSITYFLPANVENLTLTGTLAVNGTGNALDNVLVGNSAANRLEGGAGNDSFNGGAGTDTMLGGAGDDTYTVDSASDVVTENANEGTDLVIASVSRTLGANQEHLTLSGSSAINGTGNTLNNMIKGNAANNTLNGGAGTDVLQAGAGNDVLSDTSGRGVHDGGDGADTLTGGTDRQFFAGGPGDDAFTLGGGADVIAFNRGHGADTINAPATGTGLGERNDVLSLAGVAYDALRLTRDVNDLIVTVAGTADAVRLKGWYASSGNQTVSQLQIIVDTTADYDAAASDPLRNKRVARFDFAALVAAFNGAGSPPAWEVGPGAWAAAFVAGSDGDAIGGQLAYRYAKDGNLAGIDFATAAGVLSDVAFATAGQTIGQGATAGWIRLAANVSTALVAPEAASLQTVQPNGSDSVVASNTLEGWAVGAPVSRIVVSDYVSADVAPPQPLRYLGIRDVAALSRSNAGSYVPGFGLAASEALAPDEVGWQAAASSRQSLKQWNTVESISPSFSQEDADFGANIADPRASMGDWILQTTDRSIEQSLPHRNAFLR